MSKQARIKGEVVMCGWCGKSLARHESGALALGRGWRYEEDGAWKGVWRPTKYARQKFDYRQRNGHDVTRLLVEDCGRSSPRDAPPQTEHLWTAQMVPPLALCCIRCGAVSRLADGSLKVAV